MLTNSQLQQHEEVTSEMLASIDGRVLFRASESHTAWHTALGSKGFITQTKPNTAPDKHTSAHGHPQRGTAPHTHTQKVTNTVARPVEAGKVLRCAYERVKRARFFHKHLTTCCATFVTNRGLGHALKTFSCTSPAFHSSYKPSTYQHPPFLWPRRSSRMPLISFSLKAKSSQGQEGTDRAELTSF